MTSTLTFLAVVALVAVVGAAGVQSHARRVVKDGIDEVWADESVRVFRSWQVWDAANDRPLEDVQR